MLPLNLKDHGKANGSSHQKINGHQTVSSMLRGGKDKERQVVLPDSGVATSGIMESTENLGG